MGDEALAQFTAVTGAPEDAAKFYLDSSNGDVEAAINAFLEGGPVPAEEAPPAPPPAPSIPRPAAQPTSQPGTGAAAPSSRPRRVTRPSTAGGVRSLADLGDSDDDEDSDEANEYYAGGEKSGQVVRGAPKGDGGGDQVEGFFDRARQAGARQGTAADLAGGAQPASGNPNAFTGTARTLQGGSSEPAPAAASPDPASQGPQEHVITFWRNNVFTVNDGEPRSFTAPANREFLDAVLKGECPRELEAANPGVPVNVSMVRRNEDYVAPEQPRHVAFAGSGRKLSDAPASGSASAATPSAGPSSAVSTTWEGVDESQPSTSLQLRLADGSRMVARFNLTHTVADIRRFIGVSRPDLQGSIRLVTAFPAAALDDDSATIESAGLQNATVVQKPG